MQAPREWPTDAPSVKARHVTLIAHRGDDLCWATAVQEKRDLVAACPGPLWAVWTGNYRSDLFTVPRETVMADLAG